MNRLDELDEIIKDFGLEVSGGDFTKEQFVKYKSRLEAYIAEQNRLAIQQSKRFFDREALKLAEQARNNTLGDHPDYKLADIPLHELASFGKRFYGCTKEALNKLDKEKS